MPSIGGYHPYGLASKLTGLESNRACVGYAWTTNFSPSTPPTCLQELRRALLDEWCNILQDQIDNLILSMPRRSFQCNNRIVMAQRKHLDDFYVVELLDDWNVDVPSWKYPRNLESPRVSSPGFGNDSKMMLM
ncbi:uncharacterized protein TNCV_2468621 [Trichonephila clavipes]|nr:uncharacterized protein TNCV_2468621 [Trichonephila clavipes]